jgi:hypothetical protein
MSKYNITIKLPEMCNCIVEKAEDPQPKEESGDNGWIRGCPEKAGWYLVFVNYPHGYTYQAVAGWDGEQWYTNQHSAEFVTHYRELPPRPAVKENN